MGHFCQENKPFASTKPDADMKGSSEAYALVSPSVTCACAGANVPCVLTSRTANNELAKGEIKRVKSDTVRKLERQGRRAGPLINSLERNTYERR